MKFSSGTATKKKPTTKSRYDDDEDEEDIPPRRSRRDEARPAKLKRRAREVPDDDDEDEDDDERAETRSGWKGYNQTREETSVFTDDVKLTKEPQIMRFLFEEPAETWRQHWITRDGKRSFTCIGKAAKNKMGKDCPLCAVGNGARTMSGFWVVVLDETEDPTIKRLTCGPKLTDQLKSYHEGKLTAPLTKLYYAISIEGKKQSTRYPQMPIKGRDLEEDHGIAPLTSDELKALREEAKGRKGIYRNTYSELLKLARESVGEGDDDDDDD